MREIAFGLIGGLGLFIFGMKYLSDCERLSIATPIRRSVERSFSWSVHPQIEGVPGSPSGLCVRGGMEPRRFPQSVGRSIM